MDTGAPPVRGVWTRGVLIGLIFFFTNGAIAVVMNWTPSLLVRSGFEAATGASAIAWQAAGALLTMSATGFIVERSKVWPIVISLAIATGATILYAIFIRSLPLVTLSMLLLGGFLALAGTASVFLAGAMLPGNRQATGIGLCLAIGRVGQMIFPGLVGLSLQAGNSPTSALLLISALPACGAISALILALTAANTYKTR